MVDLDRRRGHCLPDRAFSNFPFQKCSHRNIFFSYSLDLVCRGIIGRRRKPGLKSQQCLFFGTAAWTTFPSPPKVLLPNLCGSGVPVPAMARRPEQLPSSPPLGWYRRCKTGDPKRTNANPGGAPQGFDPFPPPSADRF